MRHNLVEMADTQLRDTIALTIPAEARFRGVATLVLGGIGSRLELSYERVDDLQLAVLSVLDAGSADEMSVEVTREDDGVSVVIGPLVPGSADDGGLTRVLDRLVDRIEAVQRDDEEWLMLWLATESAQAEA